MVDIKQIALFLERMLEVRVLVWWPHQGNEDFDLNRRWRAAICYDYYKQNAND